MVESTKLASLSTFSIKIVARIQNPLSSPLKCCVAKSTAQISTQLTGTQLSGDLSGVLPISP